ncbi:MAG TPA: hypothetical protein EYQ00_10810 [Dehalococcoidia bacterium]|jgi:uncharacterized membrane protein|nr:hypothetical protein [Dehalococcoidia bacterium]
METISLILHVSAAALLFGPQVLMFFALTPATWFIDDEQLKRNVVSTVARRFGIMSAASILVLAITGIYQIQVFAPSDLIETTWGSILVVKMIAFVVLMILLMIHTTYFSKKIRMLSDEVINGDEDKVGDLDYLRRQSWLFSFLMLLVTTGTLWLGIALGNHQFSLG